MERRQLQSGLEHLAGISARPISVATDISPAAEATLSRERQKVSVGHDHILASPLGALPLDAHIPSAASATKIVSLKYEGHHRGSKATGLKATPDGLTITDYLPYPVDVVWGTKNGNSPYYSTFGIIGHNPSNPRDYGIFGYTYRSLGNGMNEYYYYVTCYTIYGNETIEATSNSPYYTYQLVDLYRDNPYFMP